MLAVVLGLVAVMSLVVTFFVQLALLELQYRGVQYGREELKCAAYSGLEATLAVLNEYRQLDGGLYGPSQGWAEPLSHVTLELPPGVEVKAEVIDETGRISLRKIDPLMLGILFEELGLNLPDAQMLTDSLMDWTDEDDMAHLNGAEATFYEGRGNAYEPPNRPLQSLDELRYIRGFDRLFFDEKEQPNELYRRFAEAVTLEDTGSVNLNTAPPAVLAVVARQLGLSQVEIERALAGPDGVRGTPDDGVVKNPGDFAVPGAGQGTGAQPASQAKTLRLIVTASRGDARFTVTTLVGASGSGAQGSGGTGFSNVAQQPAQPSGQQQQGQKQQGGPGPLGQALLAGVQSGGKSLVAPPTTAGVTGGPAMRGGGTPVQPGVPNQGSTQEGSGSNSGAAGSYPFEIISLVENRKDL